MNEIRDDAGDRRPGGHEPLFNAPPVSLWLIGVLAAAYGLQRLLLTPEGVIYAALSSQALREERWWTLISHIFLHGGTAHILMNIGGALAFGPAVARHFGPGVRAAGAFVLFFLVCGVAGGLGFVAVHPAGLDPVVGASGAISGLWGGAARLLGRWRGLWGIWEGPVRGQIVVVVAFNLLIGVVGWAGEAAGVSLRIAWEAHIAGFAAGLLLVGPFTGLARPIYRAEH